MGRLSYTEDFIIVGKYRNHSIHKISKVKFLSNSYHIYSIKAYIPIKINVKGQNIAKSIFHPEPGESMLSPTVKIPARAIRT